MDAATGRLVRERANDRCEYCRARQSDEDCPFEIEHVIARQHGGEDAPANLALACVSCNRHKGPNLAGVDPESGNIVRLFDPRRQNWRRHFQWDGPEVDGKTQVGRATIRVLGINHPGRVALRRTLIDVDTFDPDDD